MQLLLSTLLFLHSPVLHCHSSVTVLLIRGALNGSENDVFFSFQYFMDESLFVTSGYHGVILTVWTLLHEILIIIFWWVSVSIVYPDLLLPHVTVEVTQSSVGVSDSGRIFFKLVQLPQFEQCAHISYYHVQASLPSFTAHFLSVLHLYWNNRLQNYSWTHTFLGKMYCSFQAHLIPCSLGLNCKAEISAGMSEIICDWSCLITNTDSYDSKCSAWIIRRQKITLHGAPTEKLQSYCTSITSSLSTGNTLIFQNVQSHA